MPPFLVFVRRVEINSRESSTSISPSQPSPPPPLYWLHLSYSFFPTVSIFYPPPLLPNGLNKQSIDSLPDSQFPIAGWGAAIRTSSRKGGKHKSARGCPITCKGIQRVDATSWKSEIKEHYRVQHMVFFPEPGPFGISREAKLLAEKQESHTYIESDKWRCPRKWSYGVPWFVCSQLLYYTVSFGFRRSFTISSFIPSFLSDMFSLCLLISISPSISSFLPIYAGGSSLASRFLRVYGWGLHTENSGVEIDELWSIAMACFETRLGMTVCLCTGLFLLKSCWRGRPFIDIFVFFNHVQAYSVLPYMFLHSFVLISDASIAWQWLDTWGSR